MDGRAPKFGDKKEERQTAIMSDADALAIQNASARKGGKKGGGKGAGARGFKFSAAGINKAPPKLNKTATPGKTNAPLARPPTNTAPVFGANLSEERFYTEDGLRIPLFDARGKRFQNARDGRVVVHKLSREKVFEEYVRKYGGDAKVEEMRDWKKEKIGDWITEVETKAFGKGPKETRKMREDKEMGVAARAASPELRMRTRSMSEEIERLLGETSEEGEVVPEATKPAAEKKKNLEKKEEVKGNAGLGVKARAVQESRAPDSIVTMSGDAHNKRKRNDERTPPALDQQTQKKRRVEKTPVPASTVRTGHAQPENPSTVSPPVPRAPAQPPMAPQPPRKLPQTKAQPQAQGPNRQQQQRQQQQQQQQGSYTWNTGDLDLYRPHISSLHEIEVHPFISALDLDPSWSPGSTTTPLRTLDLPASNAHLIISTSASGNPATVHTTLIPHRDIEFQRAATAQGRKVAPVHQRRRKNKIPAPFLNPGKHGWDYDTHGWAWEGDPDLVTGVGHQVEEGDEERLSAEAFKAKYPGSCANQWPCGCQKPWEEGDSEEE